MKRVALALALLFVAACADRPTEPQSDAESALKRGGVPADQSDGAQEQGSAGKVKFWLTFLHNNDGESALIGEDLGDGTFAGGVDLFGAVVENLRKDAATTGPKFDPKDAPPDPPPGYKRGGALLVSSGDNFLASPEFNASLAKGVPYYDGIALDLIGYDALAIGNHEFDFGPDVTEGFIRSFERTSPPFLSANLDVSGEPGLAALEAEGRIARSAVVKVRGEKVGIIGATTENLPFISSPRNVTVGAVVPAVQGEVDALMAAGVDKIILISHLQTIEEDKVLISMLHGVDVAVAGGGDELLANDDDLLLPGDVPFGPYPEYVSDADGRQVPLVTTPGSYRYVGRLIVGFDKAGEVVMVDDRSGPVRVYSGDGVMPDPEIHALVVEPVAQAIADQAANVIGITEDRLNATRALVRTREMGVGDLITDAIMWKGGELAGSFGVPAPDIAITNGGGIRNDIVIEPGGDITELDIRRLLPFGNFVTIVQGLDTQRLKETLENGVSRVETVSGRFTQVAGMCFVWDPAGTPQEIDGTGTVVVPGTRVQRIVFGDDDCDDGVDDGPVLVDGGAIVMDMMLTLGTNDFNARGGDQYPLGDLPATSLGALLDQATIDYIVGPLLGVVPAADYPEFGEGRIVELP